MSKTNLLSPFVPRSLIMDSISRSISVSSFHLSNYPFFWWLMGWYKLLRWGNERSLEMVVGGWRWASWWLVIDCLMVILFVFCRCCFCRSCCNFLILYVWKVFFFGSGLSNGVTSKYDNWSDRIPICALGSPLETWFPIGHHDVD